MRHLFSIAACSLGLLISPVWGEPGMEALEPVTADSTVVDYLWTPAKDAQGRVTRASVLDIPLSTPAKLQFVEVAGSNLRPLQTKIEQVLGRPIRQIDRGVERLLGTFNDWVGGCLAGDGRFYIPFGGGHHGSSMNGIWALDLPKLGGEDTWDVELPPSDPADPEFPWPAAYNTKQATTFTRDPSLNAEWPGDMLPDGRPTSRHTYDSVAYDSKRNRLAVFSYRLWFYDLTTKKVSWVMPVWKDKKIRRDRYGQTYHPSIYGHMHYLAEHDVFIADPSYMYGKRLSHPTGVNSLVQIDPETGEVTKPHYAITTPRYIQTVRIGDKIWQVGKDETSHNQWFGLDTAAFFDASRNRWGSGSWKIIGDPITKWSEMQAAMAAPEWNSIIRWSPDGFRQLKLEPVDGEMAQRKLMPKGRVPKYPPHPGSKAFYYAPWSCVILIASNDLEGNSVFIARLGEAGK